jgi:hypothetical protein
MKGACCPQGTTAPDQRASCRHVRPGPALSSYAMEQPAFALLVWSPNAHGTVAVPSGPVDCMCQVHSATPLLSTICADPSNDRGACPVEDTTLAVQTAPAAVLACGGSVIPPVG